MGVIRLVVRLVERRSKVDTHTFKGCSKHLPHPLRDHTPAVLRREDQMYVELENNVPTSTKLT